MPICYNSTITLLGIQPMETLGHVQGRQVLQQQKNLKTICLSINKIMSERASLVAQWLRICLPMQGTRVRDLVWEDPTCRGATGPVSHNY